MPAALLFCYPKQKTLSIFKDCSCVLILPRVAVNQTYLFRKRAKSRCVWRIARASKQQAMHCGELESASPYLAAKKLKLGVPYTWNDLWSTECNWPESRRKVLMRFKWAGSFSNRIHILLWARVRVCACLRWKRRDDTGWWFQPLLLTQKQERKARTRGEVERRLI